MTAHFYQEPSHNGFAGNCAAAFEGSSVHRGKSQQLSNSSRHMQEFVSAYAMQHGTKVCLCVCAGFAYYPDGPSGHDQVGQIGQLANLPPSFDAPQSLGRSADATSQPEMQAEVDPLQYEAADASHSGVYCHTPSSRLPACFFLAACIASSP